MWKTQDIKDIYKNIKASSVKNILPPNEEDSLVRVTCPCDELRSFVSMKQAFVLEKDKCLEICKDAFERGHVLSLSCVLSNVKFMHLILDFDTIEKNDFDKDVEFEKIKNTLKCHSNLKEFEWNYSTRSGNGGIHLYAKDVKLTRQSYVNLIKDLKSLSFGNFNLDCPSNLTLPYCGKFPELSYVYLNNNGDPDPTPWCNCESCQEIEISQYKRKLDETSCLDDIAIEKKIKLSDIVEWETECTSDNAILYVSQNFEKPADLDNVYFRAAKNIQQYLYKHSERDVMIALIAEKIISESVELFPLYRDRSFEFNSKSYDDIVSKADVGPISYLFFFQFPTYQVNKDEIFIYSKRGWVKENKKFLEHALDTIKGYLAYSNTLQEWSTAKMVKKIITFWHFDSEIDEIRKNNLINNIILTKDDYFFCIDEKVFVKNCLLYPLSLDKSLYFYKNDIFLFDCEKLIQMIKHINVVKNGEESFLNLLKEYDLDLNDDILMFLYFIMTFLDFEPQTILEFISIFFSIFCGQTKHIIYVIGESANNGKTTLLSILNAAFGNDFAMFNIKEMEYTKNSLSTASPDFYKSSGKKIVCVDECGNVVINTNILKTLSSGGKASARTLYTDTKVISCNTNVLLLGNSKPILSEQDNGILNRLCVFDVNVKFCFDGISRNFKDLISKKNSIWNKILNLNIESMGLGFLSVLMSFKRFEADKYMKTLKEKQIPFGTVDHFISNEVTFNENFCETEISLVESVKMYCIQNNVNPDKFIVKIKSRFNKYFDGMEYRGFKLNNSNNLQNDLFDQL